jgi:hypothetical protein
MFDRTDVLMSFDPFDPIAVAKLRIGTLVESIRNAEGKAPVGSPFDDPIFHVALAVQAALRTVAPCEVRSSFYRPAPAEPHEPDYLKVSQGNWTQVYGSEQESNPEQRLIALRTIDQMATRLVEAGCTKSASALIGFLSELGYGIERPAADSGPSNAKLDAR